MAPTFCYRCGDVEEEGCDPRDVLAELEELWEHLRLKRYVLKRKINQLHSPIIRQLPPDIISSIFDFCLPDFTEDPLTLPAYRDTEETSLKPFSPLSLGATCSYWREIACSTPSLWTSLAVHDPSKNDFHKVTGRVREWLSRSGQLPLSIRISSSSFNKTVSALIDIINQHSPRWSNLELYIPDDYYNRIHSVDSHAMFHAPILKSIRLLRSPSDSVRNLNFQLSSPRLERASFHNIPMEGSNIQWDNLTHLTLENMPMTDTFLILRKTPRLVFCSVDGSSSLNGQSIGPPVLSSMRSLHALNSYITEDLLNNLVAPHLEEFNLPNNYEPTRDFISSFIRRCASSSLRSFSTGFSVPPSPEDFMNLLQSMPSLTTLSLSSITTITVSASEEYYLQNILPLVAKVLHSQNTSLHHGFLPNLKILEYAGKLSLHSGNYDDIYPLPSADTVHGPFHLFKLDIQPETRIPKSMISFISSLAKRGVTMKVVSESEDILQSSIDYHKCREDSDWSDNLDLGLFSLESESESESDSSCGDDGGATIHFGAITY